MTLFLFIHRLNSGKWGHRHSKQGKRVEWFHLPSCELMSGEKVVQCWSEKLTTEQSADIFMCFIWGLINFDKPWICVTIYDINCIATSSNVWWRLCYASRRKVWEKTLRDSPLPLVIDAMRVKLSICSAIMLVRFVPVLARACRHKVHQTTNSDRDRLRWRSSTGWA